MNFYVKKVRSNVFKGLLWTYYYLILAIIISTIIFERYIDNELIYIIKLNLIKENGLLEHSSAIIFLLLSSFSLSLCWQRRGKQNPSNKWIIRFYLLSSLTFFLVCMEEISWGQQLFKFTSPQFFVEHNAQRETNIHNLIPYWVFNSLIFNVVSCLFIHLPNWVRFFPEKWPGRVFSQHPFLHLPSFHVSLGFVCSSYFQIYHSDLYGGIEKLEIPMAYLGLLPLVFYIYRQKKRFPASYMAHCLVIFAVHLSLWWNNKLFCTGVFEMREFFISIVFFLYFIEWSIKIDESYFD